MQSPPNLFLRLFQWYCHPKLKDHIEGDLIEVYGDRVKKLGKRKAGVRFIIDVILLFRPGIIRPAQNFQDVNTYDMYKNFLKTAWRNMTIRKAHTTINVLGLSLGITCALLIFCLVRYHLSFDNFHSDRDRVYRFVTELHRDEINYSSSVPPAFGKTFQSDYTFGEEVARICSAKGLVTLEEKGEIKKFNEDVLFADPEFFEIFNFTLAQGARDNFLINPNTAIITRHQEKKYFGNESALGKTFRLDNRIEFTITGILNDIPDNTDFRSEIFLSYNTIKQFNDWYAAEDAWGGITTDIQTFVKLRPGIKPAEVEQVLANYVKKFRAESKNVHHYKLQPLAEVHFDAKYGGRMDRRIIYVLSAIGFLLVFTACLNFINLATAQAITRSKEVGVRKVLGSARVHLFAQFTIETGVVVILASLVSVSFAHLALPYINEFFSIGLTLNLFFDSQLSLFLLLLMLVVTFLSCSYPGVILSGFKPVSALKGKLAAAGNFNLRRALIVAQVTISQILLIGLIVIMYQVRYFRQHDMGFVKEAIVMVPVGSHDTKMKTLKEQLSQLPGVEAVSSCFASPASDNRWTSSFYFDNRSEEENFSVSMRPADENYLSIFDIELLAGRNLTPSDSVRDILVNEAFVRKMELSSPEEVLGRSILFNGTLKGSIVGVVKDFHDQSLRSDISPVFITTLADVYNEYAVKIDMKDAGRGLGGIEKTWSAMYPEQIFEYDFLDDQIAAFYKVEEAMLTIIQVFSFVALFIGGMGLYGLVSFMSVQRTKEIGIRKVLGGNVSHILWIFGKEFSRLVIMAFLIAVPIGWMITSKWLSLYAYKVDVNVWVFALELIIILGVVLLTVGYQSVKTASMNPVNSLRSE